MKKIFVKGEFQFYVNVHDSWDKEDVENYVVDHLVIDDGTYRTRPDWSSADAEMEEEEDEEEHVIEGGIDSAEKMQAIAESWERAFSHDENGKLILDKESKPVIWDGKWDSGGIYERCE